jgi:hypothetical protein
MKLLLLHPEDLPFEGPWSREHWDYIIDLGWAGSHAYTQWEKQLGCPVRGLYSFAEGPKDFRRIAEILQPGLGKLVDEQGLDWWEILAPLRFQPILELMLVQRALDEVGSVELSGTRFHPMANLFATVSGRKIGFSQTMQESSLGRQVRKMRTATKLLTPPQLLQAALDKWDPDYRMRVHLAGRRSHTGSETPVLLPSGYANVTRVLTDYAELLPARKFLLVTTRSGGAMSGLETKVAANIRSTALAGYAPKTLSDSVRREARALEQSWSGFEQDVLKNKEADLANHALATLSRWFTDIGRSFERWLRIRDAWRKVLEEERISAVLCGDENNPTNRIPVLLARKGGLRTVHCDHGALDILLPLRAPACDIYLAKGEMERDFLQRTFPVAASRISVGAPAAHFHEDPRSVVDKEPAAASGSIVFFSEQYELTHGRSSVFYREILPQLCTVARIHGTRLIIKLHPFESPASRQKLIAGALPPKDLALVDLVHGPLTPELMRRIWFAVTLESSVARDCAIRGIRCFLCNWFVSPMTGYGKQFVRYQAAQQMESPEEIPQIPERLESFRITPEVRRGLWNPIAPATLEALLRNP